MRIFSALVATLLTLLIFTGCEDEKETNLFKAQQCIDTADSSNVGDCSSLLAGDSSKRSYILRCSIAFISEDITETQIVNALENIKGDDAGNPTAPAIAALAMKNTTTSKAALDVCTLSGANALIALANFANMATTMTSILPGLPTPPYTAEDIEQAIADYNDTPSGDPTELGEAILASQSSLCNSTNGLMKDTPTCTDLNNAVSGNPDATDLGNSLICQLGAESPKAKCECDKPTNECD